MAAAMSTKIHEAHGTFTKEQRTRKITVADVFGVLLRFGSLVGLQMDSDRRAGFAFWDSCSMIEQAWRKLSKENVERFVEWALDKIRKV